MRLFGKKDYSGGYPATVRLHAETHEFGGIDPVVLQQSQVLGVTADIANALAAAGAMPGMLRGTVALVAGSAVVAHPDIQASSIVQVTSSVDGGVPGFLRVSARIAGVSFTITSSNALDTSTVGWMFVEP